MSSFTKALVATSLPLVLLSAGSTVGAATIGSQDALVFGYLWVFGVLGMFGALLVALGLRANGRKQLSAGVLAGAGIGIVSLGVTCFANSTVMNLW